LRERRILKTFTWVILCLGIFFIFYGLYNYLSPIDYTGSTRREEFHSWNFQIPRGEYRWGKGRARFSWLWLDWGLKYTVNVQENKLIDVYILNESQFIKWMTEGKTDWLFFETHSSIVFAFRPVQGVDYYFLLDNTRFNESKTVHVTSTFFEVLPTFDFTKSLTGIRIAIAGLPFLTVGLVLLTKEYGETLGRPLRLNVFPHASETEIGKRSARWLAIFFWGFLVIAWVAPVVLVYQKIPINKLENVWSEVKPILSDALTRIVLYYCLLLTPTPFVYLVSVFLLSQILNFVCWLYETKFHHHFNKELEIKAFELFKHRMRSFKSILIMITLIALGIVAYWLLVWDHVIQFVVIPAVLSLIEGYNLFSAYLEACKELNLSWRQEVKIDQMLTRTRITFMIFLVPIFGVLFFWIQPLLIEPLHNLIWKNCPLAQLASPAFELMRKIESDVMNLVMQTLFWNYLLYNSVYLITLGTIFCYILPKISIKKFRWSALRRFLPPLIAFFATFIIQEVYARLLSAEILHIPYLLTAFILVKISFVIILSLRLN